MVEEWLQTTFYDELLNKRGRKDSVVDVDMEDEVPISQLKTIVTATAICLRL